MSDENEPKFSGFKPVAGYVSPGRKLEPGETIQVYADPPTLRERVVRLLREIEWQSHANEDYAWSQCSSCHQIERHAPDCELAAVLKELEGER